MLVLKGKMAGCDMTVILDHSDSEGMLVPSNAETDACSMIQKQLQSTFCKTHQCGCPPLHSCKHILRGEMTKSLEFFICDILTDVEAAKEGCRILNLKND